MHLAVYPGRNIVFCTPEIIEALIMSDADLNCQNDNGDTPLHVACSLDKRGIILTLLKYNANKAIRNHHGWLPFQYYEEEQDDSPFLRQMKQPFRDLLRINYME